MWPLTLPLLPAILPPMHRKTFAPGDLIFQEGDESQEAYWIVSGKVEISIETPQGRSVLTTLDEGEIFGEMGMVDDKPRAATARAVAATEVEVIDEADFHDEVLRNEARLLPYLATLFERLRMTTGLLEAEYAKQGKTGAAVRSAEAPLARAGAAVPAGEDHPAVRLTLSATERAAEMHPRGLEVEIAKFPFRIGRKSEHENPSAFTRIDLALHDERPYSVSRGHCLIERKGAQFFVRDCGSRLGTVVNGTALGDGQSEVIAALQPGANTLILGSPDGPHHYTVSVG